MGWTYPSVLAFGNEVARMISLAFDNEVVLTDDGAFGNEVARMISLCSIIESNSYLRSPKSKQTKSWFTFGHPIKNPTHIHRPIKSQFLRNVAFGNEIAQTDDFVIVEATRTSALLLPKANRQVLVYFGDPIFLQTDTVLVCFWVPR